MKILLVLVGTVVIICCWKTTRAFHNARGVLREPYQRLRNNMFLSSSVLLEQDSTLFVKDRMDHLFSSSQQNSCPFYLPFFEWQLDFMRSHLTNLKLHPTKDRHGIKDLTYVENPKRNQRMVTFCFSSDEYRLIRMTLLDGGNKTQVFTSLWYPRSTVNVPLLGIDLLQFSNRQQQRHLTVVDFQPIHPKESDHEILYEHLLKPIRDQYPSLQHRMSDRFYDESDGFFSSQMLLGKETTTKRVDSDIGNPSLSPNHYVWSDLWPAYKDYVRVHVELVQRCCRSEKSSEEERLVLNGHKRYDDYSSVRDPAHGLLASTFGRQYADDFVYDVLFPLSDGKPIR